MASSRIGWQASSAAWNSSDGPSGLAVARLRRSGGDAAVLLELGVGHVDAVVPHALGVLEAASRISESSGSAGRRRRRRPVVVGAVVAPRRRCRRCWPRRRVVAGARRRSLQPAASSDEDGGQSSRQGGRHGGDRAGPPLRNSLRPAESTLSHRWCLGRAAVRLLAVRVLVVEDEVHLADDRWPAACRPRASTSRWSTTASTACGGPASAPTRRSCSTSCCPG